MSPDKRHAGSIQSPDLWTSGILKLFFKGFGIGAASIVPGLSGGTIALVLGIYSRLIGIASRIDHKTALSFLHLIVKKRFAAAKDYAVQTWQLHYLLPVGAGILAAVFSTASLISFTIINYQQYAFSFFFGLVLASVYYPLKRIDGIRGREIVFFILATTMILFVQLSPLWGDVQVFSDTGLVRFFLGGAVAMATMILPGFSGSFMLVIMGVYFEIVAAVADMDLKIISVFALGCLAGLISLAKLIHFLLVKYHSITMSFLAGLMFGSLPALWPFQKKAVLNDQTVIAVSYHLPESLAHGWPYLLCFSAGMALVSLFIFMDLKLGRR